MLSETVFHLIQQMLSGIELMIYGTVFAAFLSLFAENKKEKRIVFSIVLAMYIPFFGLRLTILDVPSWIGYVLIALVLMFFDWYVRRRVPVFIAFLTVTWYCVQQIGFLIIDSLYTVGNAMMDRRIRSDTGIEDILLRVMCIYAASMVLRILLVCGMVWFIGKRIRQCMWQLQTKELLTLLVLPVTGTLFGRMVCRLLLLVTDDRYFALYEQLPAYLWLVPLMAFLFYAGIWVSISGYSQMLDLQEARRQRFVEQKQYEALSRRLNENRTFCEEAHHIYHELRGHVTVLDGLLENENYAGAKKYLRQMEMELHPAQRSICTGNELLDVIVNDAAAQAKQKNMNFSAELSVGDLSDTFAYDLGVILSNLLTNAVEACEQEPSGWVRLSGGWQKKFFVLQVSNPCSRRLFFDKKSGLPQTSKKDARLHGIGLKHVSALAKKYFGSMDVRVENQIFYAAVMLQEQEAAHTKQ